MSEIARQIKTAEVKHKKAFDKADTAIAELPIPDADRNEMRQKVAAYRESTMKAILSEIINPTAQVAVPAAAGEEKALF